MPMQAQSDDQDSPRQRRLQRFQRIPLKFLLPNLITLLAMCAGITAIRLGYEGRYELAVAAIIFATVLDALDGRVARLLKGASRFGAELDSLADLVNFGVAPALLIYMWSLHGLKNLGWVVALALALAMVLRLARFNVAIDDPDRPAWAAKFFTGIPAPAGAALALLPMYLGFLGYITNPVATAPFILPYIAIVAFAVVSRIPTYSGKGSGQKVDRDMVLPVLAGGVLFTVLLFSFPWELLTIVCLVYLATIPFGIRSYNRHRRDEALKKQGVGS